MSRLLIGNVSMDPNHMFPIGGHHIFSGKTYAKTKCLYKAPWLLAYGRHAHDALTDHLDKLCYTQEIALTVFHPGYFDRPQQRHTIDWSSLRSGTLMRIPSTGPLSREPRS